MKGLIVMTLILLLCSCAGPLCMYNDETNHGVTCYTQMCVRDYQEIGYHRALDRTMECKLK